MAKGIRKSQVDPEVKFDQIGSWVVVTGNTTMTVGTGYIVDSVSFVEMTLPATFVIGDVIAIVGKGSGGWRVMSNGVATSQQIIRASEPSAISSLSSLELASSVNDNDTMELVCTIANSVFVSRGSEGVAIAGNYFGSGVDDDVVISSNTILASTTDGDMVVKNYKNLTVNIGIALTLANRCKGLLLYCRGNLIVNGTLSVSARGAFADPVAAGVAAGGLVIRRIKSGSVETNSGTNLLAGCGTAAVNSENSQGAILGNGKTYTISRAGGTGAVAAFRNTGGATNGSTGSSGAGLTGGGGSGGKTGAGGYSGAGGGGTCFSGGAGGGGDVDNGLATNGGANGGAGGMVSGGYAIGGAAGNPGSAGSGGGNNGGDGTGGLLIIIVRGSITVGASGSIEAKGVAGGSASSGSYGATSGGSGGGYILILSAGALTNSGSISAGGGAGGSGSFPIYGGVGGAGGAGQVVTDTIDD